MENESWRIDYDHLNRHPHEYVTFCKTGSSFKPTLGHLMCPGLRIDIITRFLFLFAF